MSLLERRKETDSYSFIKLFAVYSTIHYFSYLFSVLARQVCAPNSLEPEKVKGKIVYCLRDFSALDVERSWVVAQAGGIGLILGNQFPEMTISPRAHFLPTSVVSAADGLSILAYIYSTR